jgi:hypothetical protein
MLFRPTTKFLFHQKTTMLPLVAKVHTNTQKTALKETANFSV